MSKPEYCVCGSPVPKTKIRPQGGGARRIYCSKNCAARDWAHNNKEKTRASKLTYANKTESKTKKRTYQRQRKPWLRITREYKLYNNARTRARAKNLEFSIEVKDINIPNKCPLLNIPIIINNTKIVTPNSPSLDRINSLKGYTPNNIWVISHRANTAKSNLSLQELKMLADSLEQILIQRYINDTGR